MADIKIDEVKYYTLLSSMQRFIEPIIEDENIGERKKEEGQLLLDVIKKEFDIRELIKQRKMYYDFYVNNHYSKPKEANIAYQKYIEAKTEIEKAKKEFFM